MGIRTIPWKVISADGMSKWKTVLDATVRSDHVDCRRWPKQGRVGAMDEPPDPPIEKYITLPITVRRVESSAGRYLAVCGSVDAYGDTPGEAEQCLRRRFLEARFEW